MASTWHKTASLVMPAASVGFGFFVFIFSCIYSFGAVGLQTTLVSDFMKICRDLPGIYKRDTVGCSFLMNETAAGVIGFLFGLIQIGIGAGMFITKEKRELYKVWAVANIILLVFILPAGVLPLHVYTGYPCYPGAPPSSDYPPDRRALSLMGKSSGGNQYPPQYDCTAPYTYKGGKLVCFYHVGCNQLTITGGNVVVLCFGILGVLDAIFISASVVALAMMHQADSPSGYYPPSSAGSVEPTPSNQWQQGSVAQMPQSQNLKVPPSPNMSKIARPPG